MFVQDGFLYLIVTRHKLTVKVRKLPTIATQSPDFLRLWVRHIAKVDHVLGVHILRRRASY
jgi:hypothetical protein